MEAGEEDDWRSDLVAWLPLFIGALRHKTRGRMCPACIAGPIGPVDRKSTQPIAARDGAVSYGPNHGRSAPSLRFPTPDIHSSVCDRPAAPLE